MQVNGVVQGAALIFQNLHTVVLRRATHLRDRALAALAHANGSSLKVWNGSYLPCRHLSLCAFVSKNDIFYPQFRIAGLHSTLLISPLHL